MFAKNRCARFFACVAAAGMLASPVWAASPAKAQKQNQSMVFDVKLGDGALLGQVVSATGKPESNSEVTLVSKTDAVGTANTDQLGRFRIPVERPGVYRVTVSDRAFTIRAWNNDVAPPAAKDGLLCVTTQDTVRGQYGACGGCGGMGQCSPGCGVGAYGGYGGAPACGPPACGPCGMGSFGGGKVMSLLTNPVVIGLGVAAAIALPIALDDDDDDNNGGNGTGGSGEPAS